MSKSQISIIILTKNQKKFLKQSLPIIFTQTFKSFEVIIIDSGSTDGSLIIMRKYPVKIFSYKFQKFNHAKAFNWGVKKAKGKFLVRLSGDAIPANKYWLENLVKGLEKEKVAGAFSRYQFSIFSDLLYQIWFREFFRFTRGNQPTSFAGASCVLKKTAWEKYPFNEEWGPGEDWEWGETMKQLGYQILYNKNSLVFHEHRNSLLIQLKNLFHWLFIASKKKVKL